MQIHKYLINHLIKHLIKLSRLKSIRKHNFCVCLKIFADFNWKVAFKEKTPETTLIKINNLESCSRSSALQFISRSSNKSSRFADKLDQATMLHLSPKLALLIIVCSLDFVIHQ